MRRNQTWDVKNGKPVLVTPAVASKTEEVPVGRLDHQIERVAKRKERTKIMLDQTKAEYDELVKYEAELKALRAKIPG